MLALIASASMKSCLQDLKPNVLQLASPQVQDTSCPGTRGPVSKQLVHLVFWKSACRR